MIVFDQHANLWQSLVAVAPSPATSGVSLTVTAGDGADLPAAPFDLVVSPAGVAPLRTNAEIIRIGVVTGDVLSGITRGPLAVDPGGINRTIVVGDVIALSDTMKLWTDIEAAVNAAQVPPPIDVPAGSTYTVNSNVQVLYKIPPTVEGVIQVNGSGVLVGI
jgi:hypothetical protein